MLLIKPINYKKIVNITNISYATVELNARVTLVKVLDRARYNSCLDWVGECMAMGGKMSMHLRNRDNI